MDSPNLGQRQQKLLNGKTTFNHVLSWNQTVVHIAEFFSQRMTVRNSFGDVAIGIALATAILLRTGFLNLPIRRLRHQCDGFLDRSLP